MIADSVVQKGKNTLFDLNTDPTPFDNALYAQNLFSCFRGRATNTPPAPAPHTAAPALAAPPQRISVPVHAISVASNKERALNNSFSSNTTPLLLEEPPTRILVSQPKTMTERHPVIQPPAAHVAASFPTQTTRSHRVNPPAPSSRAAEQINPIFISKHGSDTAIQRADTLYNNLYEKVRKGYSFSKANFQESLDIFNNKRTLSIVSPSVKTQVFNILKPYFEWEKANPGESLNVFWEQLDMSTYDAGLTTELKRIIDDRENGIIPSFKSGYLISLPKNNGRADKFSAKQRDAIIYAALATDYIALQRRYHSLTEEQYLGAILDKRAKMGKKELESNRIMQSLKAQNIK